MKHANGIRPVWVAFFLAAGLFCISPLMADEQNSTTRTTQKDMQWWLDARYGMFIHWGPISIKGTEIGWSRGAQIPRQEYDSLYRQFNPTRFDAAEWVRIAKDAGMKYIVITSKHHDGFCLWDTKQTDYNIMNTPFGRDVVKELAQECKKQGIVFCTYYSILDWYQPDYNTAGTYGGPGFELPEGQKPDMNRYVGYMKNQLAELLKNYGPLGILWFDGEWEQPWTQEYGDEIYAYLKKLQPSLIINNRVSKRRQGMTGTTKQDTGNPGDYDTPEQTIGAFQTERPWETCMTICRQWAWKPDDQMKSLRECIQTLVKVAGGDGNFLFNVGPMPDGRIEPQQVERLKEMGDWLKKYGRSIYSTRGGPFKPAAWGASTFSGNIIYVHILDWKAEKIVLTPIPKKIKSASVLTGGTIKFNQTDERIEISVPQEDRQDIDTIIMLELDGPASQIKSVGKMPSGSLAAGKKAKASNVFQEMAQYGPAKAIDDDPDTRWATDAGTKQAWLEVDLQSRLTVNRAVIDERTWDRVKKFQLLYKENDQWKVFHEGTTIGEQKQVQFNPVTSRYIRLNILEATDGPTIWEFQLFGPKN